MISARTAAAPPPTATDPATTPYRLRRSPENVLIWHLVDGDDVIGVYRTTFLGAQARAARDLATKRHVRVVRWDHTGDTSYTPVLGNPTRGAWTIREATSPDGRRFRCDAEGTWTGPLGIPGNRTWTSRDHVEETVGMLTPTLVHNLPALVAEAELFRTVAVLYTGPADCVDGDCHGDENSDDDRDAVLAPRFPCPHLQEQLATWQDTVAVYEALRIADEWTRDHDLAVAGAAERPDLYPAEHLARLAAVAEAAAALKHAIHEASQR